MPSFRSVARRIESGDSRFETTGKVILFSSLGIAGVAAGCFDSVWAIVIAGAAAGLVSTGLIVFLASRP